MALDPTNVLRPRAIAEDVHKLVVFLEDLFVKKHPAPPGGPTPVVVFPAGLGRNANPTYSRTAPVVTPEQAATSTARPTAWSVDHPGEILPGQRDFRNDPWALAIRQRNLTRKAATPLPAGGREYGGTYVPGPNDYEYDAGFGWRQDFELGGTATNPQLVAHIRGET